MKRAKSKVNPPSRKLRIGLGSIDGVTKNARRLPNEAKRRPFRSEE